MSCNSRSTSSRRSAASSGSSIESDPSLTKQNRIADLFETYTRDLKAADLQRLFTRDTRDAYWFFARHVDVAELEGLPWHRRLLVHIRLLFLAFAMKLSPARRVVYGASLLFAAIGLSNLLHGASP